MLAVEARNVHHNRQLKIAWFVINHPPLPGINFHGAEEFKILLVSAMAAP